jgi:hypothetical protein
VLIISQCAMCVRARARVCVCVCVCVHAFQGQSDCVCDTWLRALTVARCTLIVTWLLHRVSTPAVRMLAAPFVDKTRKKNGREIQFKTKAGKMIQALMRASRGANGASAETSVVDDKETTVFVVSGKKAVRRANDALVQLKEVEHPDKSIDDVLKM